MIKWCIIAILAVVTAFFLIRKEMARNKAKEREAMKQNFLQTIDNVESHYQEIMEVSLKLYDEDYQVLKGIPILAIDDWLAPVPLPLENVKTMFYGSEVGANSKVVIKELQKILPYQEDSKEHYETYSQAVYALKGEKVIFENRPSYRLLRVKRPSENEMQLSFMMGNYFDHFNIGSALAYEIAWYYDFEKHHLQVPPNLVRKQIDPWNMNHRVVNPGVSTLTIRKDSKNHTASFFALKYSNHISMLKDKIAVVPAGEFQPASVDPDKWSDELDLWKKISRKYAKVFMEDMNARSFSGKIFDYEKEEPYQTLNQERSAGHIRPYFLGVVLNPLSLKAKILTVCVFESDVFDRLFPDISEAKHEGVSVVGGRGLLKEFPFTQDMIKELEENEDLLPSAFACLQLAWKYRKEMEILED